MSSGIVSPEGQPITSTPPPPDVLSFTSECVAKLVYLLNLNGNRIAQTMASLIQIAPNDADIPKLNTMIQTLQIVNMLENIQTIVRHNGKVEVDGQPPEFSKFVHEVSKRLQKGEIAYVPAKPEEPKEESRIIS